MSLFKVALDPRKGRIVSGRNCERCGHPARLSDPLTWTESAGWTHAGCQEGAR